MRPPILGLLSPVPCILPGAPPVAHLALVLRPWGRLVLLLKRPCLVCRMETAILDPAFGV